MVMFNNRCLENKIVKEQHYTAGKKGKNSDYEVKLIYYKYIRVYFHFFLIHKACKNAGVMLMENI